MPRKILVVGPAWVGDMVMAQCLFKILKQQNVNHRIEVLASPWTFSLLKCMPEVSHAIEMPIGHGELKLKMRYQIAKALKTQQFDQAIVLPNSFKSALIPWFAQIPQRTGWLGEGRYFLLNDIRHLDKKRYPLMIEQYIALGLPRNALLPQVYPSPQFHVTSLSKEKVLAQFKPLWRGRPVLALCPGAAFGTAKRWPEAYYAAVANQKIAQGWDVWLFGSKQDGASIEKIMRLTNQQCEDLSGRTELSETIDLLSLAAGVVTNDSGLMHVAAALNKPLIALYGPTSPAFTPPLSSDAKVLRLSLECQPCFARDCPLGHHRCMRDLTVDQVLTAIAKWGS